MKLSLLGAASVGALFAACTSGALAGSPAPAPEASVPSISDGFVSLALGGDQLSETFGSESASANGLTIEGAASGSYMFSSTLGFQGDLVLTNDSYSSNEAFGDESITQRNAEVALHGFYRNDQYLVGAFAQYGNESISIDEEGGFGETLDHYYGGVEGQVFLGNATLYGQVGAQQIRAGGESINGWFGTFEARYFLQPDFKIDAHIGADSFDLGMEEPGLTLNSWHAGVGAEYRFTGTPFSVFAKYDYTQESYSLSGGDSLSDNRILVGAKFNFDTPTLMDRDRSGASLKPVESSLGVLGFGGIGAP